MHMGGPNFILQGLVDEVYLDPPNTPNKWTKRC